jgi:hypothetical protein
LIIDHIRPVLCGRTTHTLWPFNFFSEFVLDVGWGPSWVEPLSGLSAGTLFARPVGQAYVYPCLRAAQPCVADYTEHCLATYSLHPKM